MGLGGNALLRRGEALTAERQSVNIAGAATALAPLARAHDLIVVHGNGPQVGMLALQDASMPDLGNFPLDVLAAETVGMIGYPLAQALGNAVPERRICALLTRVEVDPDDPAFHTPTKPVGPVYHGAEPDDLAGRFGWTFLPEGSGRRRVVASPYPLRVVEMDVIRLLHDAGVLVLCAGGGGIPVVSDGSGGTRGVEAIVDKDASAALVARELRADGLVLLTDVAALMEGWGTSEARPIRTATPERLKTMDLAAGSMGPKVAAAVAFVEATGRPAWIGSLDHAGDILGGTRGTRIDPPGNVDPSGTSER